MRRRDCRNHWICQPWDLCEHNTRIELCLEIKGTECALDVGYGRSVGDSARLCVAAWTAELRPSSLLYGLNFDIVVFSLSYNPKGAVFGALLMSDTSPCPLLHGHRMAHCHYHCHWPKNMGTQLLTQVISQVAQCSSVARYAYG